MCFFNSTVEFKRRDLLCKYQVICSITFFSFFFYYCDTNRLKNGFSLNVSVSVFVLHIAECTKIIFPLQATTSNCMMSRKY